MPQNSEWTEALVAILLKDEAIRKTKITLFQGILHYCSYGIAKGRLGLDSNESCIQSWQSFLPALLKKTAKRTAKRTTKRTTVNTASEGGAVY